MTTLVKYLFSAGCIIYVLWGLDFGQLIQLIGQMPLIHVLVAQGIVLVCLIPITLRLSQVANRTSPKICFRASLIGSAINTAFPAKMGEVAKLMVLKREGGLTMGQAVGAVFWERFADLNCLLAIGVATAATLHMSLALVPLASVVGLLWAGLAWFKYRPQHAHAIIKRLPWQRLREFLDNTIQALAEHKGKEFYMKLAFLTAVNWAIFIGFIFYFLTMTPGPNLTAGQIMTVVVASILGVTIPSAPAGVGVYESLVVGALVLAGMPKEEALAIALTLHVLQTVVLALIGFSLMAGTAYRPEELRNESSSR